MQNARNHKTLKDAAKALSIGCLFSTLMATLSLGMLYLLMPKLGPQRIWFLVLLVWAFGLIYGTIAARSDQIKSTKKNISIASQCPPQ